jgi:flavin prenyltransferase
MLRETPLSLVHARAIVAVTEPGAVVDPSVPALYQRPADTGELVDHTVARALDLFDIDVGLARWGEPAPTDNLTADPSLSQNGAR